MGLAVHEVRPDAPQFAPRDGGAEWYWWRPLRFRRWNDHAVALAADGSWSDETYRDDLSTGRRWFFEVADGPTERVALDCPQCRRTAEVRQARLDERCDAADGQPVAI